jgi:hypothetical protein
MSLCHVRGNEQYFCTADLNFPCELHFVADVQVDAEVQQVPHPLVVPEAACNETTREYVTRDSRSNAFQEVRFEEANEARRQRQ